MTVSRTQTITSAAIIYTDSRGEPAFMVPVQLPDGDWVVLNEDGMSTFDTPEACRQFVVDWQRDLEATGEEITDADRECWEAYEALALLLEEIQH